MSDRPVPPLGELDPADLDPARIPRIVAAALAAQPDELLYRRFRRGDLVGAVAVTPIDRVSGWATVFVGDVPVVEFHYSALWRGTPADEVTDPVRWLPPLPPGVE